MPDLIDRFNQEVPKGFFLENDLKKVSAFLTEIGFLQSNERLEKIEKPGEGNMNCVYRVITSDRSFIMKQARPWVEKYPQIDAPVSRINIENTYLETAQDIAGVGPASPKCLWFDHSHYLMIIEDLGEARDLTYLYRDDAKLCTEHLDQLLEYLSNLHRHDLNSDFPSNIDMRKLNHEHIFRFPFDPTNGMDLDKITPGLQKAARPYQQNTTLDQLISSLGLIYLSPGNTLIHGDFYPGSWLLADSGIKVIDPEFSFVGIAEFDLGIFLAHMLMAQQPDEVLSAIWNQYNKPADFSDMLLSGFTGVEMLRRLIGIAQLPVQLNLSEKNALMKRAASFITKGDLVRQLGI